MSSAVPPGEAHPGPEALELFGERLVEQGSAEAWRGLRSLGDGLRSITSRSRSDD
jgi:hypothetical protein